MGQQKVFRVKELFNTRFIYITFCKDFTYMLENCIRLKDDKTWQYNAGNEVQEELYAAVLNGDTPVFDLKDCVLTTDASLLIFKYQDKGFIFIDTQDAARHRILEENTRRIAELPETVVLPKFDMRKSIVDYINSLDSSLVYEYPENSELYRSLIILIAMTRPKVKIVMDNVMAEVLTTVSSLLTLEVLRKYDEFYYYTQEGVEILKLDNGILHTQRLGDVPLEVASHGGYLVPTVFGNQRLMNSEDWEPVFNKALKSVNNLIKLRPRTLREILVED